MPTATRCFRLQSGSAWGAALYCGAAFSAFEEQSVGHLQQLAKPKHGSGVYTKLTGPVSRLALSHTSVMLVETRPLLASLLEAIAAQRALVARARSRRLSA